MTRPIVLIVPPGLELPGTGEPFPDPAHLRSQPRCEVVTYMGAGDAAGALARDAAAFVLVVQDPAARQPDDLVEAVRRARAPVVLVEFERWDGEQESPIAAACRGVIAGFGPPAVAAALDLVARELRPPAG